MSSEATTDPKLVMFLERVHGGSEERCFKLWACRGEGHGCRRNRFRKTKIHCEDCVETRNEETIHELMTRITRGNA